jgi:hypothetical protein
MHDSSRPTAVSKVQVNGSRRFLLWSIMHALQAAWAVADPLPTTKLVLDLATAVDLVLLARSRVQLSSCTAAPYGPR